MHPITAETPFHRLWPKSQQPRRPQPAAPKEELPPPCGHDFLLANLRPDLSETPASVTALLNSSR